MTKDPTFSVVIPTYNRAGFIKATIESVLAQTFGDFELIVVDDGSTDSTESVVSLIRDERITYHCKTNEERAVARNTGTALATGKYITFLDSDDLFHVNHLETALEVSQKLNNPEFFHLGYEIKDTRTNSVVKYNTLPGIANDYLYKGNFFSCMGNFLRRDIALRHPFNPDRDLSGTEDYELWLRLASRYPLHCDNRITSVMLHHDDRSVVNTGRGKLEKRIELLEEYLFEDAEFVRSFEKSIPAFKANNRVYIALHLALTKRNRSGAIAYLLRALACSPRAFKNRAFYGTLKRLVF